MTELEQTLIRTLKVLESEHESAQLRMNAIQQQIDQLTASLNESTNWQRALGQQLNDLLALLNRRSRP